jgi:hypothetical protein
LRSTVTVNTRSFPAFSAVKKFSLEDTIYV